MSHFAQHVHEPTRIDSLLFCRLKDIRFANNVAAKLGSGCRVADISLIPLSLPSTIGPPSTIGFPGFPHAKIVSNTLTAVPAAMDVPDVMADISRRNKLAEHWLKGGGILQAPWELVKCGGVIKDILLWAC